MKLLFSVTFLSAIMSISGDHNENFGWAELEVKLPKAISDHTASIGENGLIYIAGGCDSPNGNEYFQDGEFFACTSLSDAFYSFDPINREFQTLASLPQARYRHSSAIVNGQVWLVGGRTVEDTLIPEVDVYDISSESWTSATLPEEYVVSDHAGFAEEPSFVYIVGGYDKDYTAFSQVARIDATSISGGVLTIEEAAPLNTARGDIIGVTSTDGKSAFISGGFTHVNGFCEPLGSSEELVFGAQAWTNLPNLVNERGEVVLVELENHLYALGGERQIEGYCEEAGADIDPGEKTVGTDEVEALDRGGNKWEVISGFPDHKFRFAAAAADGVIYVFGGQGAHDTNCQCFKTTKTVAVFGEGLGSSANSMYAFLAAWLVGFITSALMV